MKIISLVLALLWGVDTLAQQAVRIILYPDGSSERVGCGHDDEWEAKSLYGTGEVALSPAGQRWQVGAGSRVIVPNDQLQNWNVVPRQRQYGILVNPWGARQYRQW